MKGWKKRLLPAAMVAIHCMSVAGISGCAGTKASSKGAWDVEEYMNGPVTVGSGLHDTSQGSDMAESSSDAPPMTSVEYERLGDTYFNRDNLHMAFVEYGKSVRLDPENNSARYKKALMFLIAGMNQEALGEFREMLARTPDQALAYEGLGQAYFQMKDYDQAEKHFEKALELDSRRWKSHDYLGVIHDYRGRRDRAVGEYEKALALRPDDGLIYNNLGISYLLAGEYEKAVQAFRRAVGTKAANARMYNNLGLALAGLGRYDEALDAFGKGGDEAQAYNNLGCLYMRQGEKDKARVCFEKAIEKKSTFYTKAQQNLERSKALSGRPR